MQAESVVLPPQRGYPFYVTAKRYPHPAFRRSAGPHRIAPLTLLFLHSTSFHKEIYEPILQALWAHTTDGALNIREAWAVECPNHGESAVLNQDILSQPEYAEYFSCERYAEAVLHFMYAQDKRRPHIRIESDRIAAVGHSLGGVAAVFLSAKIRFTPLIIVDPFLFPGKTEDLVQLRQRLVNRAHERRNVWPSREEALKAFLQKSCRKWDPNVLKLYVQYGLRAHPKSNHTIAPYHGVTLACTREQEAVMYRDTEGALKPIPQLDVACRTVNVHVAFGSIDDIIPRYVQENLVNSRFRRFASVTWIPGVGHLVPQQAPQALAEVIHEALRHEGRNPRSRL